MGNQYLDYFGGSPPVLPSRVQTPPLDIATEWMGGCKAQTSYQKKRGVEVWLG
jgi:hypothetical protein